MFVKEKTTMVKKRLARIVIGILCCGLAAGCSREAPAWIPVSSENTITLAVTGDDAFYMENGVPQAMELAAKDFSQRTGIMLELKYFDDDADYHKAIAIAQDIAADSSIAAVLSKQETDFVDTLADIYEKSEKPFFVMSGSYDHTLRQDYEYLINDSICASDAGNIMAQYVMDQGFHRAVFCHSDTEYEEDELMGFQVAISDSDTLLAGTLVGPYTQEDFELAYAEWQLLGVDVICISNADILNGNLVRMLRNKGSDIPVISDYIMDDEEEIEANGDYLDGTVIVPLYMMSDSGNDTALRFVDIYGFEMGELAVQAYDLVSMISEKLTSGVTTPMDFMTSIKHPDGYAGLYGSVKFDESGSMIPESGELLVFKDGMFRPVTEDK